MKSRLVLFLITTFALVAGCFHCYKEYIRPSQLEQNTWDIYSAAGKWIDQINDPKATMIIGDSHIIEMDFGQINRRPIQGIAYRGATSLLLKNLAETILPLQPEASIVMIGTNDVLFGIDTAHSTSRWNHFLSVFGTMENSRIYIVNIPPLSIDRGLFTSPTRVQARVLAYNKMIANHTQASNINLIDLHSHISASGEPRAYLRSDGVHLNDHGYKMLVTLINDAMKE